MFVFVRKPDMFEFDLTFKVIDLDRIFLVQNIRLYIQKIEDPF